MTIDKYEEGGLFVVERPLVLRTSMLRELSYEQRDTGGGLGGGE